MKLEATDKFTVWGVGDRKQSDNKTESRSSSSSIVFSAHGDTCFGESACRHVAGSNGALFYGQMDNFAGVHAMMQAYFSGKLPAGRVQCQVTHGEEKATNGVYYAGARDVMKSLSPLDFVAVIDVTGFTSRSVDEESVVNAPHTKGHVIIEKVLGNPVTQQLLLRLSGTHTSHSGVPLEGSQTEALTAPYTFETYDWCSDTVCYQDETDAYRETQTNVVFLGLQVCGGSFGQLSSSGDYNAGEVFCWRRDIEALSLLIADLANVFVKSYDDIVTSHHIT